MKRRIILGVLCVALLVTGTVTAANAAESVNAGQERAAAEYLAAVAAGDAQAVAFAIHPAELDRLRITTVQKLREEAARGESAMRLRLFGDAMTLAEIERLTSVNVFRALARRLALRSRVYDKVEGLTGVRDGNRVHVIVKGRQPRDRGRVEVVELVTLVPYGKEWKAALAPELEAQFDDLMTGRQSRSAAAAAGSSGTAKSSTAASPDGSASAGQASGGTASAGRNTQKFSRCWSKRKERWSTASATSITANISALNYGARFRGEPSIRWSPVAIAALQAVNC